MILKIAGLLYIFYIIIVYLVIILFETKRSINMLKNKKQRKDCIKAILSLIILTPIMPFIVLADFLENEYNLYL